jgi:hypothetical protein
MPITLIPSPRTLGLHSPVIGPWFSADTVTLGLPEDDLAVPLTLGGNVEWRPPVAGFLSFYLATATRPAGLACLRGPSGAAFTDGRLVAVFEVLPEAGERLAQLMRALPTLGNPAVAGQATRPAIRTFALEFTASSPGLAFFDDRLSFPYPTGVDTAAKKLAYLGLSGTASALGNAAAPMRDLFRPGVFADASEVLMKFPTDTDARLWVFDARGRAVDPGAAACWWLYLATNATSGFVDLFAEGVDARTAPIAAGADRLSVQLVNPHEGSLDAATLARVNVGGNVSGAGALRFRGTGSGAVTLGVTAAPREAPTGAPDDLPLPRVAVLPDGRLDTTASLFATGAVDPILRRDHVRVAVVSVEHHLTGQPRHADSAAPDPVKRRAADQERATTRQLVDRAARPALLHTPDAVAASVMAVLGLQDGGAALPAGLVAPVLGLDWGPLAGAPADVPVPSVATVTAAALIGAGTAAGSTVANQQALMTVDVGAAAAGAWLRCWTQGFDHAKGERFRLDGGAGVVNAAGQARVVVPLPDGDATPSAPMGVDVLVVTAQGKRMFADQRFPRPAPVGGTPVAAGAASGPFLLCEEGREVAALDAAAGVRSGTTVVALGGAPALVDRLTIPAAARAEASFARAASAGDVVQLTQPAFVGAAQGDPAAALAAGGATVQRTARVLPAAWQAGFPLPGLERRELVASASSTNVSRATVGGGAALGNRHGLPPHAHGHPMCPAGPDVVAVGVEIQGPAVRGVAEYVRERVSTSTIALATTVAAADLAVPAAPASDSLWIAGLRTVAAGVEAEIGLAQLLDAVLGNAYPFGAGLDAVKAFLSGLPGGITLPTGISDTARRVARALDRRFLAAARGAREGATALAAAIARAEDLIVIETPALDDRTFGNTDDTIHLLQVLIDRMIARPGLRVVLCLPVFFDASVPRALQRIRDGEVRAALDRLASGDRERRVAVFSPSAGPGRSLKLATTAVIVDDAWAMVGTTHLWRRGLSYDSSYAVTVFDDRLEAGRPQEVLRFRRQLCADRLGVALAQVPDDAAALVDGVRALVTRGGFGRLVADPIRPPQDEPTTLDASATFIEADVWNPDGSPPTGLNPLTAVLQLTPTAVAETFATPLPV